MSQTSNNEVEIAWTPDEHCPVLDGVRGLAILSVTLYRLCKELDADAHAMLASVRRFAPIGERGVDLFFVLSGFLITGILLRTKSKRYYFRNFIFRRSLRIFPLYFVSLFLGLLVLPKLISTHAFDLARREQAFLWTYTSNLRMSWLNEWCFGPFDHFWSLAVEEHFYFVWPAVVLFLTRKQLGILCIGIVVCVGLLRTIAATNSRFEVAVSVATYFRADALCLGAWLAVFLTSSVSRLTIRRVAWISIGLLLPALMVVAFTGKRLLGIPNSLCPMLCTAGMALLLLSSRKSLIVKCFESLSLRSLGKYSYGMYVIQLPFVTLSPLSSTIGYLPNDPLLSALIYVAIMFTLIYVIAIASFHLFESRFLRLKKYYS